MYLTEKDIKFKINEHKTKEDYEIMKRENIDEKLVEIIIKSIKKYPRKYLLRKK